MIAPTKGVTTEVVDTGEKDRGRALRVVFGGTRVPYHQVSKLLMLPPGAYQLSGLVKADQLVNERGMIWHIFCAEDTKVSLATSTAVVGTFPWRPFSTDFDVPATGCHAQWLRLELAARFPIEEQVSGAVWYDGLTIQQVEPVDRTTANQSADQ